MKPFTSVDFQQAKAKHLAFKSRLRAILYGQQIEPTATVLSQYACEVGKWIYGHALIAYEDIAEVHELEKVHASIHDIARRLIRLYQDGNVEEARQGLGEMEQLADRLVDLLHQIEGKIIVARPDTLVASTSNEISILTALLEKNEQLDARIQQQVAAEKKNIGLIEAERELLHGFFMQAPAAHCILRGPTHIYEFANPAYQELIGGRNPIGRTVREVMPGLERQGFHELLHTVYTTGEPFVGKEVLIELDQGSGVSKQAYLNFVYQPIKDRVGNTEGILVFAYEVTDQVVARKAIEESESRFRSLIEQAPVATCLMVGQDLRIDIANELMIDYWGKGRSVLGKPHAEALPELGTQPYNQILTNVFTTGKAYTGHAARIHLVVHGVPGEYYFDFTYKPLFTVAGEVYGVLCMAVDVTAQVLITKELAESEARFRTMVQQAPVPMLVLRGETLVVEVVNDAMLAMIDRDRSIVAKPVLDSVPELASQPVWSAIRQVYETGVPYFADELPVQIMRDGQLVERYYTFSYIPLNEGTNTVGVLQVAVDMTTQVKARLVAQESEDRYRTLSDNLEQQVQARTRELQASIHDLKRSNENLQQFAYIASHDLQEPLRKIQSFGNLLQMQYADQLGEGVSHLERMQSAASRMSALIRDLLTFSRISTRQEGTGPVSLNKVLQTVLSDLEVSIRQTNAQIDIALLPVVQGDASQLGQLLMNLVSNALKFHRVDKTGVPVPPHIRISGQTVPARDLPARVRPTRLVDAYSRIDVTDNGIGFDEKYLDRIFQVFQRLHGHTKFVGTGVGLAICEKVAANHGGAITASSRPGQGSTFQIYLPIVKD